MSKKKPKKPRVIVKPTEPQRRDFDKKKIGPPAEPKKPRRQSTKKE